MLMENLLLVINVLGFVFELIADKVAELELSAHHQSKYKLKTSKLKRQSVPS